MPLSSRVSAEALSAFLLRTKLYWSLLILLAVGLAGLVAAAGAWWLAASQVPTKFGVIGVLIVVPAVGLASGWLNGIIITKGRLQPFIVTLAMMVGVLGIARVVAGQDAAVHPVYTGT